MVALVGVAIAVLAVGTGCESRAAAEARRRAEAEKPAPDESGEAPNEQSPDAMPLRRPTEWDAPEASPAERARGAKERRESTVEALFARAGVRFPPRVLLFRAYKKEDELEVWAAGERDAPLSRVARYGICAASGDLGPKRREGDRQVPEGFYRLGYFNPQSRFHLSMLVGYPNASDRVLSHPEEPGGEIMIHGSCRSAGCLAMSDERIEEIWVMARRAAKPVHVHIFPARDLQALVASGKQPEHHAFWENLAEGKRLFERHRRLPQLRVDSAGRYRFSPPP